MAMSHIHLRTTLGDDRGYQSKARDWLYATMYIPLKGFSRAVIYIFCSSKDSDCLDRKILSL